MKNKFANWKKEIDEISNSIWKITLTHTLGPTVEKTGNDLEQLEKETELLVTQMNKQIEKKQTQNKCS
ncbi:hypothetical protein F7018_01210 [Tenacibaculum aiptasiae]|uniref:Uncharacterized protein n=1 Tax=Tenacibaculum aiptasiae TaxID=426481 RepID=A0A7J5ASC0_9FLAO|nr:hypothetical protein [Tenacibaculum aiptasiae]KAB1160522.1 hypothetical protein F7018_01210 [Tenacibaculum aiptasiae]